MLINLYGNILNANLVVRVVVAEGCYCVYLSGYADATTATERNFVEIGQDVVKQVDGDNAPDTPDVLYMKEMINLLYRRECLEGQNDSETERAMRADG